MSVRTKKDELFQEAQEKYGKKLDRRLTLSQLEDQVARMADLKANPAPDKPVMKPSKVQNVITGNIFEYNDLFAGNPDLHVIEWEEEVAVS